MPVMENKVRYVWVALRIGMGWLFLWSFLDKLLGLGFATEAGDGWLVGGSPTLGYLEFATAGPLSSLFRSLAGSAVVEWLFMLGLLGVGAALVSGIAVSIGGYSGALMMLLLWLSRLPTENNPILDEHVIYAIVLIGLAIVKAGRWASLAGWRWGEVTAHGRDRLRNHGGGSRR